MSAPAGGPAVRRVLVAARGAAAVRLCRAVREAGMEAVVLLAAHDQDASWLGAASDQAVHVAAGPDGWPDPEQVVAAGVDGGCDGVLPGWDDLARDPDLARACHGAGLAWLGSPEALLQLAADRSRVRAVAEELELPVVPGTDALRDPDAALAFAAVAGFPVAVKPARGRHRPLVRADDPTELDVVAEGMLADGPIVVERYVLQAREIEVPVAGDGEEVVVALGTREVTGRIGGVRRVAEAPAALRPDLAAQAEDIALDLVAAIGWRGVGAVQLLLTPDGRLYVLDLRPGLSPHDAVTERVYGVDLVDAALRTGMGQPLLWEPETVEPDGYALGLRLQATEQRGVELTLGPQQLPPEARICVGPGDRVREGDELGTLLLHGATRHPVLVRARIALDALDPGGVACALPGLRRLLGDPALWQAQHEREQAAAVGGDDPDA